MNQELIIETNNFVENYMKKYDCSHNYKHVVRVKNMALEIADSENLNDKDKFIIILASLMHDISDHKYSDNETQENILREFFKDKISNEDLEEIIFITSNTSLSKEYRNIQNDNPRKINYENIRLKCVQDADRLDSLGSIGIARYFMFGVIKNKSNMKEIVDDLENRTNILLEYIKTDYAKNIAEEKSKIIRLYIEDFRKNY